MTVLALPTPIGFVPGEHGRRSDDPAWWMRTLTAAGQLLATSAVAAEPAAGGPARAGDARRTDTSVDADPADLRELMEDHGEAVFRLALSVVRDRALAEDVAQDTMLKAWLALPTFRGESSLRGWVMRIAHNTAVSTLRARRAIPNDPFEMPEAPVRPQHSVERRVESGAALDAFADALDVLDDLSRSIVVLREIEGMSYDEIAAVLDVPIPTVKTRLLRARRALAGALRSWE